LRKALIFTTVSLLLLTGCSTKTTRTSFVDDYEVIASEVGRGECFAAPVIANWTAYDDRHVYIRDAVNDTHLLITTKSMCRGLLVAPVVEFPAANGSICQNGSRIAYRWSPPRTSCGIDNIEVVADEPAARALVKSRTRIEEFRIFDVFIPGRGGAVSPVVPEIDPE